MAIAGEVEPDVSAADAYTFMTITGGGISRHKDGEFIREEIDEPLDIKHSEPPEPRPVFFYEIELSRWRSPVRLSRMFPLQMPIRS